jgi:hypothetical protein
MDPFTVSASLLAVLQVATTLSKVVKALRNVNDAKFDQVYWLATAQRERTIAWSNQVRIAGRAIPPENEERVKILLKKMETYYTQMNQKLRKVYLPDNGKMTTRLLGERLIFHTGGFEEIMETLAAVKAMNAALERIAPPLPAYSSKLPESQGMALQTTDTLFSRNTTLDLQAQEDEAEIQSNNDRSSSSEGNAASDRSSRIPFASIYQLCLGNLRRLATNSVEEARERLKRSLGRLELWGVGLFDKDVLDLDDVIQGNYDRNKILQEMISKLFVHLAIAEGEFAMFCSSGSSFIAGFTAIFSIRTGLPKIIVKDTCFVPKYDFIFHSQSSKAQGWI